ncbi:MAG: class I tRNA ligase family protein, partial [Minisyncoccota bacterium]
MAEDKGPSTEGRSTDSRSEREERILQFWKENKIFEKTLKKPSPKGDFVFYEGPPTANGKPGIHHLESRAFKDAIPRYKTMRGFRVPRKAGWDTHGLPVEIESEKKLGLKSKKEIEEYGVARFNEECRRSVLSYIGEWSRFTERIGYWVNLDEAYFTYNNSYIEAVWNVIGQVSKKDLLYKDYKVVPWCPRCGTGLSSHELAQGYQGVKDLSLYVKFKIVGFSNAYFVAWTTTPWTLPGNLALAVGENITYVEVKVGEEILVLAKDRLSVLIEEYEIVAEHKGKDMVGMEYEPLYPFIKDQNPEGIEKAFKVYTADFVTTEDGTGIVHTAVMYGQEDFDLGTKVGLPKHHLVLPDATFINGTEWLEGRSVIDESLAVDILKDLQNRGLLFKKENYSHSYPFCWRCKTRLIYYARDSWYIRMSSLRDELMKENEKINWEPDYIKHGRFGEWLREVKDWAISRERYWGTPLPVWEADNKEKIVADSVETLKKYSKKSGNKYLVMRHAGTTGNKKEIVSFGAEKDDHVTEEGLKQALATGEKLKDKKIDLIFTSPFARTRETAEVVRQGLNLTSDSVIIDERLHEINPGEFDGRKWGDYHDRVSSSGQGWFERNILGGESFQEVGRRIGEF